MKQKILFTTEILAVALLIIFTYQINQPKTPEEKTFKFLTENGLSDVQACGIMASIEINSNFNTDAADLNDNGYGLLFWVEERKDALEKFADIQGKPINDLKLQLNFLLEELNPDSENYQLSSYNSYTPEDFWNASSPEEAALSFCNIYERPSTVFFDYSRPDRISLANSFYEKFSK